MTPTLILLDHLNAALSVRDNPNLTPEQRRAVLRDLRTNLPSRYDHASAMSLRGVVLGVLEEALKEDHGSTGGTAEGPRKEVAQQEPGGPVHDSDGEGPEGGEDGGRKRAVRRRQS